MNFQVIKRTLGWILLFEAVFMIVPLVTGLVYREAETWSIVYSMLVCLAVGGVLLIGKMKNALKKGE